VKVSSWVASAKRTVESGKKLSLHEAKIMFDAGEKLNVNCHELRVLRAALRAARGWANRVKRCNLEQGCIHVNNVKDLIKEHGTFLIEMPEELSTLKQATRNYCICRRPYDGFMIGCDECDEWYHGPCIGVSESRADRFDKYVCTRCSVSNVFKNSASAVIGVIRKWTSKKDLKKARQVESQKHQRKVRKETKDIENFRKTIKLLEARQPKNGAILGNVLTNGLESEVDDAEENTDTAPSSEKSLDGDSGGEANSEGTIEVSSARYQQVMFNCFSWKFLSNALIGVESKLRTQRNALQLATERLASLSVKAAERKQLEMTEMNSKDSLRKWCLKVRSLVMVPSNKEQAHVARPLGNGSLSGAMSMVIGDAQKLGIEHFADVDVVVNAFKCMAWSLFALAILRRKPNVAEMSKVVSLASALKLPEEKGLRTMKSMLQRAFQGHIRVQKALAPKPGLTRPYKPLSMEMLKELASDVEEIPLEIPEAAQLQIVILDKGARHCICAGPSDGSFMLCCDKCELWFHGHCVNVTRESSEGLNSWLCAECLGDPPTDSIETSALSPTTNESEIDYPRDLGDEEEEIPHAPNPANMWPPFGLLGSEKANEALGDCAAIADDANLDSPKKPARKSHGKVDKIKSSASPKFLTAATPKIDTAPPKRHEEKVEKPSPSGGVAKAEPSGTPRKTYRITESGMIQLVIEHDPEPESEQPSAIQAMAGMETLASSNRNASSPRNSTSTMTGKPGVEPMEIESPQPQPVRTKSADAVVAMDIQDTTSCEIMTRPPAIDIADTRGEHKLNGLHASTSFAEVSLDPSSTTTEVREAFPMKDEPSSSGIKMEASDDILLASMKHPTGGEAFANTGATAVETDQMDESTAPPPQIALPAGMRPNEVGSSGTIGVNSPGEYSMDGLDKNDAESDDDRSQEILSELPAVLSDLLVAVKETSN
jgi:hypothetical protein